MSWFQTTNLATFAKTALKEAQKTIDKALEINEEHKDGHPPASSTGVSAVTEAASDFFSSWAETVGSNKWIKKTESVSVAPSPKPHSLHPPDLPLSTKPRSSNHKRSASLEGTDGTPAIHFPRHVESDLGGALKTPASNAMPQELAAFQEGSTWSHHQHSRSLSDTVFNAHNFLDDFDSRVQVLDGQTNEPSLALLESCTVDVSQDFSSISSPVAPNLSLECKMDRLDSWDRAEEPEDKLSGTERINNFDLLSTVDLNIVSGEPESECFNFSTHHNDLPPQESVVRDSFCDMDWNWTDSDAQRLDNNEDVKTAIMSEKVIAVISLGGDNSKGLLLQSLEMENPTTVDSGLGMDSSTSAQFWDNIENTIQETVQDKLGSVSVENNVDMDSSPTPQNTECCVVDAVSLSSSPVPSAGSRKGIWPPSIDEIRPLSEPIESLDSSCPKGPLPDEISLPFGCAEGESSRSSSIVVVSGRNSTPSSSTGSSEGHHDPENHSERTFDLLPSHSHRSHPELDSSDHKVSASVGVQTVSIHWEEKESQTDEVAVMGSDEVLKEKDEMISELRLEGEKLSKKQFEVGQVVKKLRGKEKEMEETIKCLKGEVAGKIQENDRLLKTYLTKEGVEQVQNDTISKLSLQNRNLELEIQQMKSEVEDAKENSASMKVSLEEASLEILELRNGISSFQREATEMDSLTREKCELMSRNELLQKEVDHLRLSINSTQSIGSTREMDLQSQVSILRGKVHCLENELGGISSDVADATMPLSLEIQKLQCDLKNLTAQHEKRESAIQSLVWDLELKVKGGLERERCYKDLNLSLQTNLSSLEDRQQELERENQGLVVDLKKLEGKQVEEREVKVRGLESQVSELTTEVERLTKENHNLVLQFKTEKSVLDGERKKNASLMDQLSSWTRNGVNGTERKSGENSPSSHSIISEASYLDEVFDPSGQNGMNNRSMTPKSFFESFSSLGLIENLQSQLRQRETELWQCQEEGSKNERIRRTLNEEIARLTIQNQGLEVEMDKLPLVQTRLQEMEEKNNALLQMYGEKVEEADELRLDLEDVKELYKTQIEQLVKK